MDDGVRLSKQRRGGAFIAVAATGVVAQVLTALSGPLVARMLGPTHRGEMVVVAVLALMCSQLGLGGLPMAIAHAVGRSGQAARDVVRPMAPRWLRLSVLPGVVAAVAAVALLRDSDRPPVEFGLTAFALTTVLVWQQGLFGMVQGESNVLRINVFRTAGIALNTLTVALMFVFARTDSAVIVLAVFIGSVVSGLVVGWSMLRAPTGSAPPADVAAEISTFARQSYVSGVGLLDAIGVDLLVVVAILGTTELGIYQVGVSATNLPNIVLMGIAQVLLPKLAGTEPGDVRAATIRRWFTGAVGVALILVAGMELVIAPVVSFAFGEEFEAVVVCARIQIVAWAILGIRRVLTSVAQAQGRADRASRIELACLGIMIGGVLVLGQLFGIEGAAWAVLVSALAACTLLAASINWHDNGAKETPL